MKKFLLKQWLLPALCLCGLLTVSCSKDDSQEMDGPVYPKTNITDVKEYIETVTASYAKQFQSELELANNLQFYMKMADGMSQAFESIQNDVLKGMFAALKGLVKDRDLSQLVYLKQTFPFDCKILLDNREEPPTGYATSVRFIHSEDTVPGLVTDKLGSKKVLLDYYTADSMLLETYIVIQYDPNAEDSLDGKSVIEKMELICPKSVSMSMSIYDKKGYFVTDVFNAIIYPSVDAETQTFRANTRIDFPNGRSLSFTDIVTNTSKNMKASLDIFGQTIFDFSLNESGTNLFDCQFGFKTKNERVVNNSALIVSLGQELSFEFDNINDDTALSVMLPVILSAFADYELTVDELKQILSIDDPISYSQKIKTSIYAYKISYGADAAAEICLVERSNGKVGLDLIAQDGSSCPIVDVKFFGKDFNELFTYLVNMVSKLTEMGIMIQGSGFSSKIFDLFLK